MAAKKKATKKRVAKKKATAKKPVAADKTYLTIAQASKLSGRAPAQFYNWKSSGKAPFKFHTVGGKTMIGADEFKAWAAANPKRKRRGRKPGRKAVVKAAAPTTNAATGTFTFACKTPTELQSWVGFIGHLAGKGVKVTFTVGFGED